MSDTFDHALDAYESLMHDEYYHEIDTDGGGGSHITYDRKNNYLEFELGYIHQTKKAVLFEDGTNQVWIAKSQIKEWDSYINYEKGEMVWIEIPEWIAISKNLY